MPAGAPTKYKKKYCREIIAFFDFPPTKIIEKHVFLKDGTEKIKEVEVPNDYKSFIDYAKEIGVCRDTLLAWSNTHKEFSVAYNKAKELQERNWAYCSLRGMYNAQFTIFLGKNVFKWADKQQHEISTPEDKEIRVSFVDAGPKKER